MEALSMDSIPEGDEWQYEPKWDGFRCIVFRDGKSSHRQSIAGPPRERYFPELVAAFERIKPKTFVLDGEIVIPVNGTLSFDDLLMRIHPAESRIRKLAEKYPASFIAFDLLASENGKSLLSKTLSARRELLEQFASNYLKDNSSIRLSPAALDIKTARNWFKTAGRDLDGIIAKRRDLEYRSGDRTGMQKIKPLKSVDCVIGGFRYGSKEKLVGSLLLGLYDDSGLLNHVGFCSGIKTAEKAALTKRLQAIIEPPGFTGQAPGGPSRWSTKRSSEWEPLAPKIVVEVSYDHFTGGRFRHGTKFLRWRPDKAPRQCTLEQLGKNKWNSFALLNPDPAVDRR
jgi:ATP-dependent DNA ligase